MSAWDPPVEDNLDDEGGEGWDGDLTLEQAIAAERRLDVVCFLLLAPGTLVLCWLWYCLLP